VANETNSTPHSDLEIKKAAQLSITEIGIGSIGHGFKIPLTGQVLSLNQLAFLLNALNRDLLPKSSAFEISSIAAILKSFSPAGQKLGPMLSIAMQGFLFWFGVTLFGSNIVGQIVGAILLALWAFVQPFVTMFMIYGFDLVKLIEFYSKRISEDFSFIALSLVYAFTLVLVSKLLVAIGLVVLSLKFKKEVRIVNDNKLQSVVLKQIPTQHKSPFKSAVKDLFKPFFLFSFILMMVFVWQVNGSLSQKIWLSLRPLAIAFVIFYLLRSPWVADKLLKWSQKSPRFEVVYLKAKKAFEMIKSKMPQS
jgi:hypothetical protein